MFAKRKRSRQSTFQQLEYRCVLAAAPVLIDLAEALGSDMELHGIGVRDDGTAVLAAELFGAGGGSLVTISPEGTVQSAVAGGVNAAPWDVSSNGQWFSGVAINSSSDLVMIGGLTASPGSLIDFGPSPFDETFGFNVSNNGVFVGSTLTDLDAFEWDALSGYQILTGGTWADGISADGSLIVGIGGPFSDPMLWNADRTPSQLPNRHESTWVYDISPSGEYIGGRSRYVDSETSLTITVPSLWVDIDGVVEANAVGSDYAQINPTYPDGSRIEGEISAVTDNGYAFIDSPDGVLVYHQNMRGAVLLETWLLERYGLTLPDTPRSVPGAQFDPTREMLHLSIERSHAYVAVPVVRISGAEVRLNGNDSTRHLALFQPSDETIALAPEAAITGIEGGVIASAEIVLGGFTNPALESLAANAPGNLQTSYEASTGVLTISGYGTAEEYQAVIRSLTYQNLHNTPVAGTRTIEVTLFDDETRSPTVGMDLWIYGEAKVWQNSVQKEDTDTSGNVNLTDALVIIGELRNGGPRWLNPLGPSQSNRKIDVDGNDFLSLGDPLVVIAYLRRSEGEAPLLIAEGELEREDDRVIDLPAEELEPAEHDDALLALLAEYA